jgi:tRNA(Phe) wybutosine-synthesizing methylase Tyw3
VTESRLALYQQISLLKASHILAEKEKIAVEQENLTNSDLDALRKLQKSELLLNRLKEDFQSSKANKFELQNQINSRKQK